MMLRMYQRLRSLLAGIVVLAALGGGAAAAFTGTVARPGGYTVQPGDTLSAIASHFGVGLGTLAAANNIADQNMIFAGQRLAIPTSGAPLVAAQGTAHPAGFPQKLLAHPDRLALLPSFRHWASVTGVPAGLLEGMAWMESGWQRTVVSSTGAVGVGQLEPATVTFVSRQLLGLSTDLNPRDTDANIRMSATYLSYLLRQAGGNATLAIGGYYQGLASMRAQGPFLSTRVYIATVRALWTIFGAG